MYKDHPDVYHFFIDKLKLLNGEVLIGYTGRHKTIEITAI